MAITATSTLLTTGTYTQDLGTIDLGASEGYSLTAATTVSLPAGGVFTVDPATDLCTLTAHGMATGLIITCTTAGVLPAGLAVLTNYYVINVSANTFKLATSRVNATAGTAIDITDAGTGDATIVVTALVGASIKLQASNDASTWIDVASSSNNITVTASFLYNQSGVFYRYVRAYFTVTSGQVGLNLVWTAKDNGI